MATTRQAEKQKISWYRSPVDRDQMRRLLKRSNWKGLLQASGHLGLLLVTGTAACLSIGRLPWPVTVALFFMHGTFFVFVGNPCHELSHNTVFKTKALNQFFLPIYCFLSWHSDVFFWASHTEHHKYTLHPPSDLEVVLPAEASPRVLYKCAVVNPWGLYAVIKIHLRHSLGKLTGEWEHVLFAEAPEQKKRLTSWARILLLGHGTLIAVPIYFGYWQISLAISLAPFYGGWLQFFCNQSQHAGLRDNVPDFRLCCRTFTMNPFVTFLYWHMNYHTEHHMYASVPCYNLKKLHQLIKRDLPACHHGLIPTWREIFSIQIKQKKDPEYQYQPELPATCFGPPVSKQVTP